METIIVICYNLLDFHHWLIEYMGFTSNGTGKIFINNGIRYIAVTDYNDLRGYSASNVLYTYSARIFNDNFEELLNFANRYCLIKPIKKKFKFGR